MGQKTHPYGFRLGYNKGWKSRWFAKKDYADLLHEDVKLRAQLRDRLRSAGIDSIDIEPTRIYNIEDARQFLTHAGVDVDAVAPQVEGKFMGAFIRAVKPEIQDCCGPACCS